MDGFACDGTQGMLIEIQTPDDTEIAGIRSSFDDFS
jgi:hypothetical protein